MKKSVPGFGDEKAPEPPKYAVQEDGTLLKISGAGGGPKKLDRGTVGPIAQRTSEILPIKRYDQPVHHYHEHHARKSQSRDTPGNNTPGRGGPPPFIGNTFHHIPNTPSRSHLPAPKTPTLARAFVSMPKESFDQYNLLHNRTAAGLILGSPLKRYVGEGNVPSLPEGFTIQTSAQAGMAVGVNVGMMKQVLSTTTTTTLGRQPGCVLMVSTSAAIYPAVAVAPVPPPIGPY